MQVFKEVCEERRWQWKMLLDGSTTARLERLMHADALTIIYGTSHALEHGFIRNLTTSRHMLVASVGKAFMATGPKNRQLKGFRSFVESYGCKLNDLKLMPKTFLFSERKECLDFFIHISKNTQSTWIVKPYGGYGGENIEMYYQLSPLIDKFGKCDNQRAQYLAQEYLSNPLLLNGRKFDVRAYILIARTNPYFVFYHAGYLRVAINKFSSDAGLNAHLTNTHIQSHVSGYVSGNHFWTYSELQQYIHNVSTNQDDKFVQEKLEPMVKQVGLFLLHSSMRTYERLPGTYLLLGLDFMITSDYHIWFIEANNYPLWPSNAPKLDKQTYAMANELLDLEMEIHSSPSMFVNLQPGAKYGSWELVYNELSAHCSGQQYNPCKDFPVQ
ncbi:protein polyglycylase TTLL10-like [Dysidea avara]|uniref:protein polyglycylase TTLL10-like n=1 Tax=Dysidea avara TaxID=196820 RepID=UPI00332E9D5F